jgi:hypothetical protein
VIDIVPPMLIETTRALTPARPQEIRAVAP